VAEKLRRRDAPDRATSLTDDYGRTIAQRYDHTAARYERPNAVLAEAEIQKVVSRAITGGVVRMRIGRQNSASPESFTLCAPSGPPFWCQPIKD
jgi:hypothetical protein